MREQRHINIIIKNTQLKDGIEYRYTQLPPAEYLTIDDIPNLEIDWHDQSKSGTTQDGNMNVRLTYPGLSDDTPQEQIKKMFLEHHLILQTESDDKQYIYLFENEDFEQILEGSIIFDQFDFAAQINETPNKKVQENRSH